MRLARVGSVGAGGAAAGGCRRAARARAGRARRTGADRADARRARRSPSPPGGKAKLTATLTSAGKPLAGKSVSFLSGRDRGRQGEDRLEGPRQQSREAHRARDASSRATRRPAPTRPPTRRRRAPPLALAPAARVIGRHRQLPARGPAGRRRSRARACASAARVAPYVAGRAGRGLGLPRAAAACSTRPCR